MSASTMNIVVVFFCGLLQSKGAASAPIQLVHIKDAPEVEDSYCARVMNVKTSFEGHLDMVNQQINAIKGIPNSSTIQIRNAPLEEEKVRLERLIKRLTGMLVSSSKNCGHLSEKKSSHYVSQDEMRHTSETPHNTGDDITHTGQWHGPSLNGLPSHGSHGAHAESHNTEGHHVELSEDEKSVASAQAVILLGSVAWMMGIVYLLHAGHNISLAIRQNLSSMISIFCAVLIFNATRAVSLSFFGEATGNHHALPDLRSFVLASLRFLAIAVWLHCSLCCFRRFKYINAVGVLGGHILGFSAIDVFGTILQAPLAANNIGFAIATTIFAAMFHWALNTTTWCVRERFKDAIDDWQNQCMEIEDEAAGLVLGLLVSMLIRNLITGHMPPVHGQPLDKTSFEVATLLVCTVAFGLLVLVVTIAGDDVKVRNTSDHMKRIIDTTEVSVSMTMGWCALFWGQWAFWSATHDEGIGMGDKMTARMLMALLFSAVVFVSIYIIDWIARHVGVRIERGLRSLIKTMGLVMGLSWEASFTQSMEGIGRMYGVPERSFVSIGLTVGLCGLVLPAWVLYIYPHTKDLVEREHRSDC